uniref:STAS domain-containing protein n=1 Tax=Streptomyces sp. CHD11 TaxID=2741325 RepID=UPI0027E3EDBC|nr:STAS domain-containing protein [Streptomyces sp. CHD11]
MTAVTFLPNRSRTYEPSERVLFPLPTEIDFSNADGLLPLIMAQARPRAGRPPRLVVLDLTATRFMDSQGVRLINGVRRLLEPGTRVYVVARPESLAGRVLELTGLRRDIPVYDNLPEAMAA